MNKLVKINKGKMSKMNRKEKRRSNVIWSWPEITKIMKRKAIKHWTKAEYKIIWHYCQMDSKRIWILESKSMRISLAKAKDFYRIFLVETLKKSKESQTAISKFKTNYNRMKLQKFNSNNKKKDISKCEF